MSCPRELPRLHRQLVADAPHLGAQHQLERVCRGERHRCGVPAGGCPITTAHRPLPTTTLASHPRRGSRPVAAMHAPPPPPIHPPLNPPPTPACGAGGRLGLQWRRLLELGLVRGRSSLRYPARRAAADGRQASRPPRGCTAGVRAGARRLPAGGRASARRGACLAGFSSTLVRVLPRATSWVSTGGRMCGRTCHRILGEPVQLDKALAEDRRLPVPFGAWLRRPRQGGARAALSNGGQASATARDLARARVRDGWRGSVGVTSLKDE